MELIRDWICPFHELDVVEHDKWIVHATDLQVVRNVLLQSLLLGFVCFGSTLDLHVQELDFLVDSIVSGLLAQIRLALHLTLQIVE